MKPLLKLFPLCAALAVSTPAGAKLVRCHVALDQEVVAANSPQKVVVKVALDAETVQRKDSERPAVNLCIVLDRSGSMQSQDKLEKAKEAAIDALRRLSPKDRFSFVVYSSNVETVIASQPADDLAHLEAQIRAIRASGNTALFGGVSQGAAEVRKQLDNGYVNRIILLSDGLANRGPSTPADLERLGASLMKEGISVTTMGLGSDYNEDLMTGLAERSDGNTWFVESVEDLAGIFDTELGEVLNVVAKSVTIEIECADGVKPIRVIGRDARIHGNRIEVRMSQLHGGQEKYVLVELEVPAGVNDSRRKVATARCRYAAATDGREYAVETEPAYCRYSTVEEEVTRNVNVAVQADYNYNILAETQDRAVQLADQGKQQEAYKVLKDEAVRQQQWAADNGVSYLQEEAQVIEQQAEILNAQGASKEQRKWFRENSYKSRVENRK